ncbi:MAG: hypothetical protein CL677_02970 [Bdellovibrionaceae bacterium]|nr:hypothetical protein [Pseudobdellovibrionaceae bacterium]|tara:strand:- start:80635 stop:81414 length:780 start_codon:yes stop_codon:yes gene_type:complete
MIRRLFNLVLLAYVLVWNNAIAEDSELLVAADSPVIEFPFQCIEIDKGDCSVQTKSSSKFVLEKVQGLRLHLAPDSVLLAEKSGLVSLVSGEFVIEASRKSTVKTEFSDINVFPGLYLVSINSQYGVRVVNLDGFVTFQSGKAEHAIKLEEGFEIEVSRVRENGWFEFSFPRPAPYTSTIELLSKTMTIEKSQFYTVARTFQPVARKATQTMSEYYKDFTERKIASHKDKLKKIKERQARVRKINEDLRTMFRKENYLE